MIYQNQNVAFFMFQFGMAKKRMTLDEVEAARRRAVSMFERFGDSASASEFSNMTAEAYAQHKGVEIINSNPRQRRRTEKMSFTKKEQAQFSSYIASITDDALSSNTRADLYATIEEVNDLATAFNNEASALIFNADGTVEIESEGSEADDDENSDRDSDHEDDDEDDDDE